MGQVIDGQYELLEEIGSGGMGKVYRARDFTLTRDVAIKVLHGTSGPASEDRRRRFIQEARAASGINHPNIITIHRILQENDTVYIVMEYLTGKTLYDAIPEGGLRSQVVLSYATQIAQGLAHAHAAGIIHRDLKPGNIMINRQGHVKLLDFGLAKLTEQPSGDTTQNDAPMTVEGSIMGTLCYMSPEQAQGRKVDKRTDIFSFGAVLYEMATGARAFVGDNNAAILSSVLRDEPVPALTLAPDLPVQFEGIIQRCLAKRADDRFQSMDEVLRALQAMKPTGSNPTLYPPKTAGPNDPTVLIPSTPPASAAVTAKANKTPLYLGLATLVAVVLGGVYYLNTRQAPPPAVSEVASAPVVTLPPPAPEGLTNKDVLDMVAGNIPERDILEHIKQSKTNFDLSGAKLVELNNAKVSAAIIAGMRNPSAIVVPPASVNAAKATLPKSSTPPTAPVTAVTPVPTPTAPAPATTIPSPAPPTVAPPPVATQELRVAVPDGFGFNVEFTADVKQDAPVGSLLPLRLAQDLRIADVLIASKGATVAGIVMDPKKTLMGGTKVMYKINELRSLGGPLKLRAVPNAKSANDLIRELTPPGKKDKGVAAPAGATMPVYIDGNQNLVIKK